MGIMLITIRNKIPFFNDNIYLYKEFQIISYFWIGTLAVYFLSGSAHLVFGDHVIIRFIGHFGVEFSIFIVPFLSTYWVLQQIAFNMNDNDNIETQNKEILLPDILKDDDTLNLFMHHLIDEFSMECLLSLIEFIQFKTYSIKELKGKLDKTDVGNNC